MKLQKVDHVLTLKMPAEMRDPHKIRIPVRACQYALDSLAVAVVAYLFSVEKQNGRVLSEWINGKPSWDIRSIKTASEQEERGKSK